MSEKKFKESDVVINTQNGKEYYITRIEKVYDADLKHSVPTGYAECRPNNLDDNLPNYNRFPIDIFRTKEIKYEKEIYYKRSFKFLCVIFKFLWNI